MRGVLVVLCVFAAVVIAQESKKDAPKGKPQWQRMLTGDDEKAAKELTARIDKLDGEGKRAEAAKAASELLALRTKVQGSDHWQVTDARIRLADLERSSTPDQVAQLQKALKLNAAAVVSMNRGKYAQAESPLVEAIEIVRKTIGEAHPIYATMINNLGQSYHGAGNYAHAALRYRESSELFAKTLGESHPKYADSLNILGVLYRNTGEYVKAEATYSRALDLRERILGKAHPDYAQSVANMAVLCEAQGNLLKAKLLALEALALRRKLLGEDHRAYAASINNLGVLCQSLGEYAEAEQFFLQALALRERILGESDPTYAQSVDNLAVYYLATGSPAKAEPLALRAQQLRRKILGEAHPDYAQSLFNLAECYRAMEADEKAEPLLVRAMEYPRSVIGESHPLYTFTRASLALVHSNAGKWAKAEPLLVEVLDVNRRHFGEVHMESARSLYNLATIYWSQERYADAEPLLRQAVAVTEAARLTAARGLDRAIATLGTPAQLLAATQALRADTLGATDTLEQSLARGLLDEQVARRDTALTQDEAARRDRSIADLGKLQPRMLFLAAQAELTKAERTELENLIADRKKINTGLAELAVAVSRREVADLAAIRKALPADTAWVCWLDLTRHNRVVESWACIVRSATDPVWVRLPGTGEKGKWTDTDSALPDQLRVVLGGGGEKKLPPGSSTDAAELIKKLLAQRLEPVLKHLGGVKTLYATTTGPMAGVPVEVLAPEFTVSYIPSGTFLARLPKKIERLPTLLAVGDAIYEIEKPRPAAVVTLPPHGLLVEQLDPNGVAAKAGLKAGDVILSYAEALTKSSDDLSVAVQKAAGVKDATLTFWRAGNEDKAAEKTVRVPPGTLGVVLARDPAPQALADRRKRDEQFASLTRGEQFGDIPGTRYEVTRIAGMFDQPKVLLDDKASEQDVDALRRSGDLKKFRYLHFAAHGKGNTVRALESKLVLSQDRPRESLAKTGEPLLDNAVTAREVLDHWELDADLVTLSACETAIGVKAGGEGLLGFAQAFLAKGSRAVCLSLWEVDDTATALLMTRFYQNLLGKRDGLKGPMPKAAGLKEAKEWLRELSADEALKAGAQLRDGVVRSGRSEKNGVTIVRDIPKVEKAGDKPFAHPKHWAAFILIGDPN
jgi:tetratricopeptide (TPR) repeat protein